VLVGIVGFGVVGRADEPRGMLSASRQRSWVPSH
jgi:hypothetical protein